MKQITFLFLICLLTTLCYGQRTFILNKGSENYSAVITVEKCLDGTCEGKGTIELINKKSNQSFQTLATEDLYFYIDSTQTLTVNIIELYGEQSPLIFDDFNFDGTEDIAIRNGNNSSYGGPSYDIYVYNITNKKFELSEELTTLAVENLGMFQTDHKRKKIITYGKSGCCWHIYTEYEVISQIGLEKVYEVEEDAQLGDFVTVTTHILKNNKWKSSVKQYKISEYYK